MAETSKFPSVVAVESGGGEYPRLYCPACGKQITPRNEGCPHLLFECAFSGGDGSVPFNYIHPKLNKTTDALAEEFRGTDPKDLGSKLNLDATSTMVLCVTNMLGGGGCSEVFDVVVGIEFPPPSKELTAYKKAQAKGS